jgi:hypothetical protein
VPAPVEVRVAERAGPEGTRRLVVARADGTEHAEATVGAAAAAPAGTLYREEIRARCLREFTGDAIRARCAAAGLELGPTMAALRTVWAGADEVLAHLLRPAGRSRPARGNPRSSTGRCRRRRRWVTARAAGCPCPSRSKP